MCCGFCCGRFSRILCSCSPDHDILFDIEFETTWEVTSQLGEMKLNDGVPTVAEYLGWRDSHVMTEILEYG